MSRGLARCVVLAVAAVCVLVVFPDDAKASSPSVRPGDLDTTFGADGSGRITFNFGGNWDAGTRIIIQPDGKYLVAGHGVDDWGVGFVARYLPDGTPDTSFNGAGQRKFGERMVGGYLNDLLLQPDGKIVVVIERFGYGGVVMRLNADGSTDVGFGDVGQLVVSASEDGQLLSLGAIAMLPDGRLLVAGSEGPSDGWGGTVPARPFTLRLLANGQPDPSYGPAGRVSHASLAGDLVPRRIALHASGRATIVGGDDYGLRPAMAIRLNGDGTADTAFASAGKYVAGIELEDLLVQADSSLIIVGTRIERLTPSGQPDIAFGNAGGVILRELGTAQGVTRQLDGKLLVSGSSGLVARLMPTGALDPTFGTGGFAESFLSGANAAAVDGDGRIVVVGGIWRGTGVTTHPFDEDFALTRLIDTQGMASPAAMPINAIEYYHPQFEHYFVTADPAEISALDSGRFPGWARTGERYSVYKDPGAGRAPVCRFYTDAFAGKPTHFYTASTAECEHVKGLPAWVLEGIAFHAPVPDGAGACAAGTTPVYRLYNDGRGGAPNHAYTPDAARRDALAQAGWIAEGTAWCVPL